MTQPGVSNARLLHSSANLSATTAAPPPSTFESDSLRGRIAGVDAGAHVCLLYDCDPAEQTPALATFIAAGLAANEQVICVTDDQTVDEFAERLSQRGIDARAAVAEGRLKLWTRAEWREPGALDASEKARQFRGLLHQAKDAGFEGIRFTIEMTWALDPAVDLTQLEHWEATLNTLLQSDFPVRMICQYNRARMGSAAILAALRTHPLVIEADDLHRNPFYQAPLVLDRRLAAVNGSRPHGTGGTDTEDAGRRQSDWILAQLRGLTAAARQKELQRLRADAAKLELEAEKRRTDEFCRAIVESSRDCIKTLTLDGVLLSVNEAASELLCIADLSKLIGQSWFEFWEGEDRVAARQAIDAAVAGGKGQFIGRFAVAGEPRWWDVLVTPIRDACGRPEKLLAVSRDVTAARLEQKRAEEKLEHAVAERTETLRSTIAELEAFSYSISHDLRGPLRSMQGFAEILEENFGAVLGDEGCSYLLRIRAAASRMDRLIQDVLTLSRAARAALALEPVDMDPLVRGILECYPNLQARNATVQVEGRLPRVLGNPAALTQCMSNLLGNAVKFVPPERTPFVRVWAEEHDGVVRVNVADNGIGVPADARERIFQMFERLDPRYDGTGIGLAIVKATIARLGGRVGVESELGAGSTFWVELRSGQ